MIRPLAAFLHALDAARTAGTLTRTVLVLGRQLDNAHLLAASEGARADRAEAERDALQIERDMARDEVDELRREIEDWREASGELAAEQPADDVLPDLTDAGETPIPLVLADSAREAEIQQDRADALAAALRAAEMDLIKLRAELESVAERKLAADIRADVQRERAEQAERERDTNARAAGAHIATINDLRKRLDDALRAVHRPAPAEQIPGVAVAGFEVCDACGGLTSAGQRTGEAEAVLLCRPCRTTAEAEEAARADARRYDLEYDSARNVLPPRDPPPRLPYAEWSAEYDAIEDARERAGTDDPPPTRPSERATATRAT